MTYLDLLYYVTATVGVLCFTAMLVAVSVTFIADVIRDARRR